LRGKKKRGKEFRQKEREFYACISKLDLIKNSKNHTFLEGGFGLPLKGA